MAGSLFQEVDADTITAEVVMLRAASRKTVMLVEGGDDEKVYGTLVDDDECEIVICYGHENARKALANLEARTIPGILCVIDADFAAFVDQGTVSINLLQTDHHDLEVMLFRSTAFDKVIGELGSKIKINKLKSAGTDPRDPIWKAAHKVGIFRLYSIYKNVNLTFEGISFKFVDRRSLTVDVDMLIKVVFDNSRKTIANKREIVEFIEMWLKEAHDHWHMCCGHDICCVLGKALQSFIGSQNTLATDLDTIERSLRLAYSKDQFKETNLFKKIRDWEARNSPFVCLQTF